jgi:hypothetical protein
MSDGRGRNLVSGYWSNSLQTNYDGTRLWTNYDVTSRPYEDDIFGSFSDVRIFFGCALRGYSSKCSLVPVILRKCVNLTNFPSKPMILHSELILCWTVPMFLQSDQRSYSVSQWYYCMCPCPHGQSQWSHWLCPSSRGLCLWSQGLCLWTRSQCQRIHGLCRRSHDLCKCSNGLSQSFHGRYVCSSPFAKMFTQLSPVFIQSVPMSPRSALMFPQTAPLFPGSKTLFPRSAPLISCCMRASVGEDVSHVEQGTTAACFVPGEWSIQRAEPHGPPQEAWSPPRCRYRRISSSLQLPFSSLRILKRPAYSTRILMKVSLLE